MNVVSAWSLAVRCKRQSGNEYKKSVRDKWGRNHEMLATKTNPTSKHLSIKKMLIKLLTRLYFQFNSMRTAIKSRLQLNEAKQPIKNIVKYSRGRQADGGLYAGEGGHPPLMPRCLCGPLSPAWEGQ